MAGSINLSLSQQFDKLNGNLLSGGRLYFYAAGTDSPQNAFKDTGLTLVHPNPVILASDGRVPQLYFADGSIHVRLTDNAGVVQFDEDFILVIGPSSGGGGGGGSTVDPNAIFQTGMIDWQPVDEERSGWVRLNGNTIGNSTSGAHYHAAEGQSLYIYNYGKYGDAIRPVSGGRTGNALNDWTSGKRLTLLDMREIIPGGLSQMGASAERAFYSLVPTERGDRNSVAGIIGEIVHTLSGVELPVHNHPGATDNNNADHSHQATTIPFTDGKISGQSAGGPGGNIWYGGVQSATTTSGESNPHAHNVATSSVGSGAGHNNTPRIMVGTFFQRL